MGVGAGAVVALQLLQRRPSLAETMLGQGPLGELPRMLSRVTGTVPLPVAELVVAGFLVRQGVGVWRDLREIGPGPGQGRWVLASAGTRLGQDLGILTALFVLLWGAHYARPELPVRIGLDQAGAVDLTELARLSALAVAEANQWYLELHGMPDAGVPTPPPAAAELRWELEQGWEAVTRRWALPRRSARDHGPSKSFVAGSVLRRFGVAGMYFPFTGESLVLPDLPGSDLPRTKAHEMAHQRGWARESDANALAFLVTRESTHPAIRYSAALFLQGQLLAALAGSDLELARTVASRRLPGVRRDLEERARFWESAHGWTVRVGRTLNDAMLRAHGVPDGVASYQGSVGILVALARAEGAGVLFSAPAAAEVPAPPMDLPGASGGS